MSECTNCGSALTMRDCWPDGSHATVKYGCQTEACELIRSLREERDSARRDVSELLEYIDEAKRVAGNFYTTGRPLADCFRDVHEAIPEIRDAERDRIADWLRNTNMAKLEASQRLRNNEHRSDT